MREYNPLSVDELGRNTVYIPVTMGEAVGQTGIPVADYLEGEKIAEVRHEYVNGEVFAMVGTTKAHNLIVLNLALLLRSELARKLCRVYVGNVKVHIETESEERFYYPDLHVECQPFTDNSYYSERPKLIIEVLSHSTERDDRSDKFYAYRKLASLEEYVLVTQDDQRVEVYRRSNGWDATVLWPRSMVRLESVGADLAVAAIYA